MYKNKEKSEFIKILLAHNCYSLKRAGVEEGKSIK